MKKFLQVIVIALAFAVASVPAWALGLGQIQVKSRLNEPFLAHIPIISNDPAELQELSAKLADPETFVRIGLPLPDRLVSDLHFSIETGDDGKPFVKVTSVTPVTLPELDFLVEVQWSDGRLVREYSALMAAPNTIAGAPPVIEAPTVAAANTVERMDTAATGSLPDAIAPTPSSTTTVDETPVADSNLANTPSVVRDSGIAASGKTYGPIRYGETLGDIAREMAGSNGDAVATMQQLLALNRDAFIGGNINRLKAGAVLRTPEGSRDVKPAEAEERAAVTAAAPSMTNRAARAEDTSTVANTVSGARRASTATAPKASREARLKIVAPTANNDAPTTRSGGGTQGDGDMLQQQLQQANESIASKDAEINELKSRVAELEQLKNKQAQLIAIKDTQLASAEKNLETRQASPSNDASSSAAFPWMGLTLGLSGALALAGLAWFFLRRKAPKTAQSATPRWLQEGEGARTAPSFAAEMPRDASVPSAQDTGTPVDDVVSADESEQADSDHDALSKIAKARACIVVGDKSTAREILEELLAGTLLPETRLAAEQLMQNLR